MSNWPVHGGRADEPGDLRWWGRVAVSSLSVPVLSMPRGRCCDHGRSSRGRGASMGVWNSVVVDFSRAAVAIALHWSVLTRPWGPLSLYCSPEAGLSALVVQDARFVAVSPHRQVPGNRKVRTSVDARVGDAVSFPVMPSVLPTAMSGQYVIPSSRSYVPSPGSMYLLSSSSGGRGVKCGANSVDC